MPCPDMTPTAISERYDFFLKSSLAKTFDIWISINGIETPNRASLKAMLV